MALALKLNGIITTSIPGSPSNGDAITIDNGYIRLTFTYGDHVSSLWSLDYFETFDGSSWQRAAYGRDRIRLSVGGTEKVGTDVLTIVTNIASTITLKLAWSSTVAQGGVNWSANVTFTIRTSHNYLEIVDNFSGDANYTGTVDLFGAAYLSAGQSGSVSKTFVYGNTPSNGGSNPNPAIIKNGNIAPSRTIAKINGSATISSNRQRGYNNGGAYLLTGTNVQLEMYYDPASYVNLLETLGGVICYIYGAGGFADWWTTVDAKYRTQHADGIQYILEPGITKVNPTQNTIYTCKIWMNAEVLLDSNDSTIVKAFNNFAYNATTRISIVSPAQTLTTLSNSVTATMASNYSTYFNSTYGFIIYIGDSTQFNSFANAMGLSGSLKLYKSTGTTDYLTNATRIKNILLSKFQASSGVQKGAFYKLWNGSAYRCQEANHNSNTDQPHISMYAHAEVCYALFDYYLLTGDSSTLTALINAANYLLLSATSSGYWYVEQNNLNVYTTQNANQGSTLPGSATVSLGAFLILMSRYYPNSVNSLNWYTAGLKALNYWRDNQTNPHGTYEYGENYDTYSSHALRMIIEGFGRAYELIREPSYKEALNYYMEMAIAQTKKVDTIFNASASNNKDIHTGGLLCTLDWNGQVGPEALSIYETIATIGLRNLNSIQKYHLFYLFAQRSNVTYGMFSYDYTTPSAFGYSYISPGTNYAASTGLDNTRMGFQPGSAAIFLIPHYFSVQTSNENIYAVATESDIVSLSGNNRNIILYNPQSTTQTATITIKNFDNSNKMQYVASIPSAIINAIVDGKNLVLTVSLTSEQIVTIITYGPWEKQDKLTAQYTKVAKPTIAWT